MAKRPIVTIGIAAYNEEANIEKLLKQILTQKLESCFVDAIIVASDGSTDKTAELVNKFEDKRIILIKGDKRCGKAFRQNQIVRKTTSDILVLLDADTSIEDLRFIEKLINPIITGRADFTSSALMELPPRGFFERVLEVSMQLKRIIFATFKDGNNIYNCHGPARAFNKKSYHLLNFVENEGEDMYSYLACVREGMTFLYVDKALIKYRLPSNLNDHMKQSTRFFASERMYETYFNSGFSKNEFTIPHRVFFKVFLAFLPFILRNFLYIAVYIAVLFYTKLKSGSEQDCAETWQIASSKSL